MQNQEQFLLVITTSPNESAARSLADNIIDQGVAACVNILPGVISIYQWKGEKQQGSESILFIKTTKSRYADLEQVITSTHPYELPEVIAVPISEALPDYLSWIKKSVTNNL